MGMNGHALPHIEDDLARPELPDTDADDLEARARKIGDKVADLATEALRVRDQHATALDNLRAEVLALRREVDRLAAAPRPVEHFETITGEPGWAAMRVGAAVSAPHGRGIVVEQHAIDQVGGGPAFLVAWVCGEPWLVRRGDFQRGAVALVRGPRPPG